MDSTRIKQLTIEHHRVAMGIGETSPRLSWMTTTSASGWEQAGYQLRMMDGSGAWVVSEARESCDQVLVPWPFAALASRQRSAVSVRVWSTSGDESGWSAAVPIEVGLLDSREWLGRFVEAPWAEDTAKDNPSAYLRRDFHIAEKPTRARLYVTAHGVFEPELNGTRVGSEVLAPGWTSYRKRLRYSVHDVTSLLRQGDNTIGAILGDGWYRGRLAWGAGRRNVYGNRLGLLAQLEVTYEDGGTQTIVTDPGWKASTGAILSSSLYDGESYDARLEPRGWSAPGYDDREWDAVHVGDAPPARLDPPAGPAIEVVDEMRPVAILASPGGAVILDFGQIVTGRIRLRATGPAGTTVTLRHAEVLEDGELCTRPLRTARCTDRYTLRGGCAEEWEPRFTLHGFRYVEVSGWPGELHRDELIARLCRTNMERTGWFECSNSELNRLHENVVWSVGGNFVGVPTDCPQRDERLGWAGDAQVIAPSAAFIYDCASFYGSWLIDLALDQRANGSVPMVVPEVPLDFFPGEYPVTGWGDASVVVPRVLHERFGDLGVVGRQMDSMKAWGRIAARAAVDPEHTQQGFQFGDWLDPAAPPEHPEDGRTDPRIVMFTYAAQVCRTIANYASLFGDRGGSEEFTELGDTVLNAFDDVFVSKAGLIASDSQTAYALALRFDALRPDKRKQAESRLVEVLHRSKGVLGTGFLGSSVICDVLVDLGRPDLAFALLTRTQPPSWLYPVTQGATTIWERWDSLLPDGRVNPGDMTSFNHYSLGAVADWMHRSVAGLAPASPGYRSVTVRPIPGGGITSARARHVSPYGPVAVSWSTADGQFQLEVEIPPNTSAEIYLPKSDDVVHVGSGTHTFEVGLAATSIESVKVQAQNVD